MVMDPALMATADGPMGPPAVEGPPNAIQALAEFLGMEEMRRQQVEQVASLAMAALQEFMDPGMATADGMMGPQPMAGPEDDPMGEEPVEPADEMATEYR